MTTTLIYSTFPNKKEAEKIGRKLVQKKLAACVNVFQISSIYSWRDKIEKSGEFSLIIKTKKEYFKKIEKIILKNHPYDTPCILEIPLGRVNKKYFKWLNDCLKNGKS